MGHMQRRQFITLFGGAAAAWPLAAGAQQDDRIRRIGTLWPTAADDAINQARNAAFLQGLQQSGWKVGNNVRVEARWSTGEADDARRYATELVALAPDVILANGSAMLGPLLQVTRAIPIVFANVPDPVGAGLVESLARPGGNATGFTSFEYGISAKWLELLKEVSPGLKRVAVIRDPVLAVGAGQYGAIQSVAPSFGIELRPINLREAAEIERAVAALATSANGGIIVTASPYAIVHRELIIKLAARHKVPAIYYERFFVGDGGLMSYGPDSIDQFRQAAGYVDRILKGEKPSELAVQAPTKNELLINLKTAKALGLIIPPAVLARADEVIE
jgi:putative tryptophan/tyrosine transport system substrate-binding protein